MKPRGDTNQSGVPAKGGQEGSPASWWVTAIPAAVPPLTVWAYESPSPPVVAGIFSPAITATTTTINPDAASQAVGDFQFKMNSSEWQLTWAPVSTPAAITTALIERTSPPPPASSQGQPNSEGSITTAFSGSIRNTAATSQLASPTNSQNATSSTLSPSRAANSTASDNGVSAGAVAGIAIGCLVAGAVIAGLILWFCLGRFRKSRKDPGPEASSLALIHPREKGPTAKIASLESGSPIWPGIDSGVPQPLEDAAISTGIAGIALAIKNHIQSFYHSNRVSPGLLDLDDLQALGNDLPMSTGTLSTLLGNPDTREIALRFCIAWMSVSRMQLSSGPEKTLLPPEIARCFQSMALTDRSSRVQTSLLPKWRAITAELMQSTYVRNSFSPTDSRHDNVEKALKVLEGILRPYADSRMDNTKRVQNLREILKRAANFAFTLFSQPSSWDFDWQERQGIQSGSLCIFPALMQVTDEAGERLQPPRAFSEAVIRQLDG